MSEYRFDCQVCGKNVSPTERHTAEDCVGVRAMSDDYTGRGWVFGDEPCTYSGGCALPLRTHFHEVIYPTGAVVVRFYDELASPHSPLTAPERQG